MGFAGILTGLGEEGVAGGETGAWERGAGGEGFAAEIPLGDTPGEMEEGGRNWAPEGGRR